MKQTRTLLLLTVLGTVLLASCTGMQRNTTGQWLPGQSLASGATVLLMPVPDGKEKEEEGPAVGSGAAVGALMRDTLIRKGYGLQQSEKLSVADAVGEARGLGFSYVLKVSITEIEDNATEWSGRPDSFGMAAELYDARTGLLVATASHRIQGGSAQMFSRSPERFYPEAVDHVLGKLFGWTPTIVTPT